MTHLEGTDCNNIDKGDIKIHHGGGCECDERDKTAVCVFFLSPLSLLGPVPEASR